jgi:hypothetical protein
MRVEHEHSAPTSQVLAGLLDEGRTLDDVTLSWILSHLGERSFGIVTLVLGLIGLLPGVSGLAGTLLAIPAFQMVRGQRDPVFPKILLHRRLPTKPLWTLIARAIPALRSLEAYIHPRGPMQLQATKCLVGVALLLLGGVLVAPVPFSNVVPALVVVAISLSYLEQDGLLLCLALAAAIVLLAAASFAAWQAVRLGVGWRPPRGLGLLRSLPPATTPVGKSPHLQTGRHSSFPAVGRSR